MVYFERALCVIAYIWAEAWRGRKLDGATIKLEVSPLLRLFNKSWQETRDWSNWHVAQNARGEFYELLVDAVVQHGPQAIEALRAAFEREWDNVVTSVHWSADVRRKTILALWRVGIHRDWVTERLRTLEESMLEELDVSGRIDACSKQSEAWLAVGDQASARRLLDQMLRMSFGVGYRKDYQLETWIEWLGYINAQEPIRAAERIAWFAQAAVALEETTEGAASRDAAHALLAVAFRWSPRRAISLFQWFLKQRVIGHAEATCILLAEALKSPESPTALVLFSLADFLLPVATQADPELAALLIEKTATHHGTQQAVEAACYFLSKVSVYALPSTRTKWRRGIARALQSMGIDLQRAGLAPTDLQPDQEEQRSSRSLKLRDASTLSIEEVQARVSSVVDLQELLNDQAVDSSFDWRPIIVHLVKKIGVEDIYTLASLFGHNPQLLAILSEQLSALGEIQGAWSLGEQVLNASQAHGWLRWWDGGSRLAAFRALAQANPIRTRPLVV
jgi:hypothetical protein